MPAAGALTCVKIGRFGGGWYFKAALTAKVAKDAKVRLF